MKDIFINTNEWFTGNCDLCGDYLGDNPKIGEPLNFSLDDNYNMCRRCYRIALNRKDINKPIKLAEIQKLCRNVRQKLQIDKLKAEQARKDIADYIKGLSKPNVYMRNCQICHKRVETTESCCDESDLYRDLDDYAKAEENL